MRNTRAVNGERLSDADRLALQSVLWQDLVLLKAGIRVRAVYGSIYVLIRMSVWEAPCTCRLHY